MKIKAALATSVLSFLFFAFPVLAETQSLRPTGTPPYKIGLTETRLRSCQARENAVKIRMNSLLRMTTNVVEKFDAIAERVKNFYTNTVLPTGKSVSNYDALVNDIAAKKAQVEADLTAAKEKLDSFTCKGDDPKGLLTRFRTDMQKIKTDLKNFRASIKNLIVVVRRLAPTPTATAVPSPAPTATP